MKRTIHIFLFALACQLISAPPVHAGWDFYFFRVNTKTFKEADWKIVAWARLSLPEKFNSPKAEGDVNSTTGE